MIKTGENMVSIPEASDKDFEEAQNEMNKQLKRMQRSLLDDYLTKQHRLKSLPRMLSELTESEKRKFFHLYPTIKQNNINSAIDLLERTMRKKEREAAASNLPEAYDEQE